MSGCDSRNFELKSESGVDVEHPDRALAGIKRWVLDQLRVRRDCKSVSNGHPVESFNRVLVFQARRQDPNEQVVAAVTRIFAAVYW